MARAPEDPAATLAALEIPPKNAPPVWYQNRGRALEGVINTVLTREGLEPRTAFRPQGEEVDGSFQLGDRAFLLEAKWRKDPVPASDLYAFKGKVDGKLIGTIGVFISMSDFSRDAIDALKAGKDINLILFSSEDFRVVARGEVPFAGAMRRKLRYAAEEGQPYLPLAPDEFARAAVDRSHIRPAIAEEWPQWDVVVEGANDEIGLRRIIERLSPERSASVRIWAAGGLLNVPSLVRNLVNAGHANVAAVLNRGDAAHETVDQLKQVLAPRGGHLIIADPNMEDWLELCCPNEYIVAAPPTSVRAKAMRRFSGNANLKEVLTSNADFRRWVESALGVTEDEAPDS